MSNQAHTDPTESITHLSLAQVLPDGVVLALHHELGFAAILRLIREAGAARLLAFCAHVFEHL